MTEKQSPNYQNRTLLAVLAHPDDESFGMGGTLAFYAKYEIPVHLVCATRGEVGEVDPDLLKGFNSISERREHELRCAADILHLSGVHFLNYRDSGMPGSPDNQHPKALAAAPLDQVAADVSHFIRLLRPQVVLTFDPIGGYRHPDHIAIHKATERAFLTSGDPHLCTDGLPPYSSQKLYYHLMPRRFLRFAVRLLSLLGRDPHHFGKNGDIDLTSIAEVDFPVHAIIDYHSVAKAKMEASACHASQGGGVMNRGIIGWWQRTFNAHDTFMRAYPEPQPQKIERDLFEGI